MVIEVSLRQCEIAPILTGFMVQSTSWPWAAYPRVKSKKLSGKSLIRLPASRVSDVLK